jgi:hypothetical protein
MDNFSFDFQRGEELIMEKRNRKIDFLKLLTLPLDGGKKWL